jgi:hypothetical protein
LVRSGPPARPSAACCRRGWQADLGARSDDADGSDEQTHRPFLAGEDILAQLGRPACRRCRDAAFPDVTLSPSVLRCLGAATIEAPMIWPLIARKPAVESAASKRSNTTSIAGFPRDLGSRQRFAKGPDRIGVGHRVGKPETEKAHERQPVADQLLGPLVRQIVARLHKERLEHQHVIEGRAAALCAVRTRHRALQIAAEQLEIDHRVQPLEAVAFGRDLPQPLVNVKKPCPRIPAPQSEPRAIGSPIV